MLVLTMAPEAPQERDRFTRMYQMHRKLMFHIAGRILKNPQDMEDAVQQALLYLAEHFNKVGSLESRKTRAYIAVVTEHAAIDLLRERKRHAAEDYDELMLIVPEFPIDDPLGEALGRLPANYRQALLLRYACGYGVGEVADMFGVGYDAARKLIARAKKALEKELEEKENG